MHSTQHVRTIHIVSRDEQSPTLEWENADGSHVDSMQSPAPITLCVGDGQDAAIGDDVYHGNAVSVQSSANGEIALRTSLTGFPPLFCYRGVGPLVVSSTIRAIAATPGVRLHFDPKGVAEWIRIGKPIAHRTLFRDVQVLPAGVTIQVSTGQSYKQTHAWSPPTDIEFASYDEYLDAQAEAFSSAVHRTDTSRSFISLTAGLDTRAVLAVLIKEGRRVDAVTMSGRSDSIDARRARILCKALGMRHAIIRQDDEFLRALETHAFNSVRLSGGLSGLDGALEVYMYSVLGGTYQARLSGNLGNQVGRSGTEGVGVRELSPEWFSEGIRSAIQSLPTTHWHQQISDSSDGLRAADLIQRESLFASMGNASIGSAFAVQQTPYSDRRVLENKLAEPVVTDADMSSVRGIRMRDLHHRMFGEPVTRSFQRRVVVATAGPIARIPINWGWRPTGGMSIPAMMLGGVAGLDAMLTRRSHIRRLLRPIWDLFRIQGLHGFGSDPLWCGDHAKVFLRDTLNDAVKTSDPLLACAHVEQTLLRGELTDDKTEVASQLSTLILASRLFNVSDSAADK